MRRKIIGIFICTLLIVTTIPITGQVTKNIIINDNDEINPSLNGKTWMKTYNLNLYDCGYSVLQTDDGFILVGVTDNLSENFDVWLIKTNSYGDIIWDKTFGGEDDESALRIRKTNDGGYIIGGETQSSDKSDIWLIKIDTDGNLIWDKKFGNADEEYCYDVEQTEDNGYIIVGLIGEPGNADAFLYKTDEHGDLEWSKTFGGYGEDAAYSVVQALDGGYVISGYNSPFEGSEEADIWLFKTDSNGEMLWEKIFGGTNSGVGFSVQLTNDESYIVTGFITPQNYVLPIPYKYGQNPEYGIFEYDVFLIKTDDKGELLWEKTYYGFSDDIGFEVKQTRDYGYIIFGANTRSASQNGFLIKTNSNGDKEWRKTYGKIFGFSAIYSGEQTTDGGYILTGYKRPPEHQIADIWLIKTDANGNVARNRATRNVLFYRFLEQFPILHRLLSLIRV